MTLLLLCLACGDDASTSHPLPTPPAAQGSYGWVGEVALSPSEFGATIAAERRGWTALHAHDYRTATASFSEPTHRARPELSMALLHHDLALVGDEAASRLFDEWAERGGLPEHGAARAVAALAAWCSGSDQAAQWAAEAPDGIVGASALAAIAAGTSPLEAPHDDAIGQRLALHVAARRGEVETLEAAQGLPMVTEEAHGFTRAFYDPCAHHALATGWEARAAKSLDASSWRGMRAWGDGGLAGRLFSPWLDASDLLAEVERAEHAGLVGVQGARLDALGLPLATGDDPQLARELVRSLDGHLDTWRADLLHRADAEGDALIDSLGLVERFRQEWLVVFARHALHQGHPRAALAVLQQARDVGEPEVGPANSPSLFALTAAAEIRAGHTRQALDALEPLSRSFTAVRGVQELVGDLAVLQGLDRQGDSKESQ